MLSMLLFFFFFNLLVVTLHFSLLDSFGSFDLWNPRLTVPGFKHLLRYVPLAKIPPDRPPTTGVPGTSVGPKALLDLNLCVHCHLILEKDINRAFYGGKG